MPHKDKTDEKPGEPAFEVPIQALGETLGREFFPGNLKKLDLKTEDCHRLHDALYAYHRNNRIMPVDSPDTVRPNLSFVSTARGLIVERGTAHYPEASYLPRNGAFAIPVEDIKRTLLFTDAVVIEDPVFAFCRAVTCSRYHESIPPLAVLERLLLQLAELRPLLERRLLRLTAFLPVPVENALGDIPQAEDGAVSPGDVADATIYGDDRALALVAAGRAVPPGRGPRRSFVRDLQRADGDDFEWLYRQAESLLYGQVDAGAYSPHLPNDYQYAVFKKLLLRNGQNIDPGARVAMELTSGCAVDPDKIGIGELVDIHRNEAVFAAWRELVRQSVNAAVDRKDSGVSSLDAFREEVNNRGREWRANFQRYNKGRLGDALTAAREVEVGSIKAIAASAAAIMALGLHYLPALKLMYKIPEVALKIQDIAGRRAAETAALSFFTAVRDTRR